MPTLLIIQATLRRVIVAVQNVPEESVGHDCYKDVCWAFVW